MRKALAKIARAAAAAVATIFSPQVIIVVSFFCWSGLAVAGVYVLFGTGWALLAGSVPFLVLTVTLIRGLPHE